jgi:hypothetical protein
MKISSALVCLVDEALGYTQNPRFAGDSAACIISEHIHLMLGTHAMFREFSHKDVCNTWKGLEVAVRAVQFWQWHAFLRGRGVAAADHFAFFCLAGESGME